MSVEGIFTSRVDSTPNYNPAGLALSNSNQGNQGKDSRTRSSSGDTLNLSPEAQTQVRELQQRDSEVRTHEQAHISTGGQYVRGGINYTYTRGPDNKQYATGGSVSLDTSPVADDPDATIEKARIVRSAALAPSNPSAQDQSVAAQASAMEANARSEKAQEQNQQGNVDKAETNGQNPSVEQSNFAANFSNVTTGRVYQETMPKGDINNATFTTTQAVHSSVGLLGSINSANNLNTAHAAYKTQQRSAFVPSSLAPWGTGISLRV